MEIYKIRKYVYSIPFVLMGIGFLGLINKHWFAIVPSLVSFTFASINYQELNRTLKVQNR